MALKEIETKTIYTFLFALKGHNQLKNAENDAGMIYKNDYATMLLKSQTKKKKNWKATKEKINQT